MIALGCRQLTVGLSCLLMVSLSVHRFEEEQRQLNERKKQAIESYRRKKGGGGGSDAARSLSPLGGGDRRNVNLSEYQEVPRGATPNEERDRMEQKVKDALMTNFLTTTTASEHGLSGGGEAGSLPGTRGQSTTPPTNSPMRERRQRSHSHVQSSGSKTTVVSSGASRGIPQASVSAPGVNNSRVASSMAMPAPLRVPQVPSGVSPGGSSSSSIVGIASPQILPSPVPMLTNPSTQQLPMLTNPSTQQLPMLTNPSTQQLPMLTNPSTQQQRPLMAHLDSGEWTPYASAPVSASGSGIAGVSNLVHTGSGAGIGEVFSKAADLSEFDPVAKNQSS